MVPEILSLDPVQHGALTIDLHRTEPGTGSFPRALSKGLPSTPNPWHMAFDFFLRQASASSSTELSFKKQRDGGDSSSAGPANRHVVEFDLFPRRHGN